MVKRRTSATVLRDGPCELPARVVARRLRRRQLTAVEALNAHLERIEKHNTALNAVVSLDPDRAMRRAKAADAALRRGKIWGPRNPPDRVRGFPGWP